MKGIIFYVVCICIVLILFIFQLATKNEITHIPTGEVFCNGSVVGNPDIREGYVYLVIRTDTECDFTKIRVKVGLFPEFYYGDVVQIRGKLEVPENFETDLGKIFRYREYLLKDGITAVMFDPEIKKVGTTEGFSLLRTLFFVKKWFVGAINSMLPSPHAELLGGLLVGAKQSLGDELLEDFRIVGLIHIVVLSGFNVVIIIKFVGYLLSRFPRTVSLTVTIVFIILFALLVGLNPPIVRASIMAVIAVLGSFAYRTYDVHRAFVFTLTLMAIENPMILLYDPSFQLSVLATAGLLYVAPVFEKIFSWVPEKLGMREIVIATVATYLAVLPFLVHMMGEVSVVSLVVNLLVLPIIPITMLFGFVATLLFAVLEFSFYFDVLTYWLLSYELLIVDVFAALPFATIKTPQIHGVFIFFAYVAMVIYLLVRSFLQSRSS